MGAFLDGEWESICKLFTVEESPDLSCNFLEYSSPVSEQDDNLTFPVVPQFNENSYSSLSGWISDPPHRFLQTKTTQTNSTENCADNLFSGDILSCIDFSMVNAENDGSLGLPFAFDRRDGTMHGNDGLNTPHFNNLVHNNNDSNNNNNNSSVNMFSPNTELTLKRKRDAPVAQESEEEKMSLMEPPKKNARLSKDAIKKKRKATPTSEDEITPTVNTKESNETADSNSDDSNPCVSEEINETEDSTSNVTVSLTSTGKKRASRGAATDPQSLYARKRRMRINERLKILQQLVPNGTKVDISTMLEEAFHYVKFLQLQIQLLSSDEMWMYAPLAYNGLDVGAYRRMPPFHGL